MLEHLGESIKGKTFCLSGFGNVAWGAALKITELGGKVLTLSGPDGYIYDKDGVAGKKPWGNVKADVYMPCAMQNEIRIEDAKAMVSAGVKYLNEVSNMPTTNEALSYLQANGVIVAPSKAVNAGGVAVSGLEMSQNSERLAWTEKEVDDKLKHIMKGIHTQITDALSAYGMGYDLVAGANPNTS